MSCAQECHKPSTLPPAFSLESPRFYLDNVQFGQQVAVGQGHLVAIQELAGGDGDVLQAVLIDLVRERGVQVLIQLLQGFQEATL